MITVRIARRQGTQATHHKEPLSAKRRRGGIAAQTRNDTQPAARNGKTMKRIIVGPSSTWVFSIFAIQLPASCHYSEASRRSERNAGILRFAQNDDGFM